MTAADGSLEVPLAQLTFEEMGVQIDLPIGWSLEADEVGDLLRSIGDDDWDDDGYVPSIVIERGQPLPDDDLLDEVAAGSLEEIGRTYVGFELLNTRRDADRAVRIYEFEQFGRRVRQVQGLVADVGLYIVTATAPMASADQLQATFEDVIGSLRHVDL